MPISIILSLACLSAVTAIQVDTIKWESGATTTTIVVTTSNETLDDSVETITPLD